MTAATPPLVEHDASAQCFFMVVDAVRCVLDYTRQGTLMTITHTGVPEALGGRGLAAQLTHFALEYARAQRWKVMPRCSYVATYMQRHAEFGSLLA